MYSIFYKSFGGTGKQTLSESIKCVIQCTNINIVKQRKILNTKMILMTLNEFWNIVKNNINMNVPRIKQHKDTNNKRTYSKQSRRHIHGLYQTYMVNIYLKADELLLV